MHKIFCIVVTYNAENWIEKCLDSIYHSTVSCSVIAVDNNSTDSTLEILKSKFSKVKLIENKSNLGFGKANNIGIELAYKAGANYFLLLNQDAWIESRTIETLINQQQNNSEFGILSPLQLFEKGRLDYKFKKYLKGQGSNNFEILNSQNKIIEVRFVNAAIWLVSKFCIDTVGVFAPIFDHYGEDQNYIHRCKYHGVKIGVAPDATAYHEREQSHSQKKIVKFEKLFARDKSYWQTILLNIKHSLFRQIIYLLFNSIKTIIKSVFTFRFRAVVVVVVVVFYRVKCLPQILELIAQRNQMVAHKAFFLEK